MNPGFIKLRYTITSLWFRCKMKNTHKLESCALNFPVTIDFLDLGAVKQVVEETFSKEPNYKNGAKCQIKVLRSNRINSIQSRRRRKSL